MEGVSDRLYGLTYGIIDVANMNEEALEKMFEDFTTGVYYGWAQVGEKDTTVYPMVMSLGWNPYYNNEKRSAVSREKKCRVSSRH